MEAPDCPAGFVTKADLFAAFVLAGVSVSEDQLERWRGWRLLPSVKRIGRGRASGGSTAFYPEVTINQALEASRLFGMKRNREFVGFELWWRGFEVDQKYWRPIIEARSGVFLQVVRKISKLVHRAESSEKIDKIIFGVVPKSIVSKPIKGYTPEIPQNEFSDLFHTLFNAIGGGELTFEEVGFSDDEQDHRPRTIQKLLGFSQAGTDRILEKKIEAGASFPSILKAISAIKNVPQVDDSFFQSERFERFLVARDEVRDGFEIASNLHRSLSWIYGARAFGLKAASWFHDYAPPSIKAEIALLWMCAREEFPSEFYSSAIIKDMHERSCIAASLSAEFKAAIEGDEQLTEICSRKRLKKAFSNEDSFEELRAELKQLTM